MADGEAVKDIEGLKAASERVLASLEEGRPKPTRNALRTLLLAWNLNHYSYQAWMRAYAPDHLLRWSRLRGLWAEAFHGFIQTHKSSMSCAAMARTLGVRPSLVYNALYASARKDKRRNPNKTRRMTDAQSDALDDFVAAIHKMGKMKIPDPQGAYGLFSRRLERTGLTRGRVAHFVMMFRPDVYAQYKRLQSKRAVNLLRIGLGDGCAAMAEAGDLNENSCKYILWRVRHGFAWYGVGLRDGELVNVPKESKREAGNPA
jgi:hypothetical protein